MTKEIKTTTNKTNFTSFPILNNEYLHSLYLAVRKIEIFLTKLWNSLFNVSHKDTWTKKGNMSQTVSQKPKMLSEKLLRGGKKNTYEQLLSLPENETRTITTQQFLTLLTRTIDLGDQSSKLLPEADLIKTITIQKIRTEAFHFIISLKGNCSLHIEKTIPKGGYQSLRGSSLKTDSDTVAGILDFTKKSLEFLTPIHTSWSGIRLRKIELLESSNILSVDYHAWLPNYKISLNQVLPTLTAFGPWRVL